MSLEGDIPEEIILEACSSPMVSILPHSPLLRRNLATEVPEFVHKIYSDQTERDYRMA